MAYEKKTSRRPNYESDSDQEQYPKLIVLQSKELPRTKLSPFIIEKNISVTNLKNETILIEMVTKQEAETLLKLKKFHNINKNTWLNTLRFGKEQRLIPMLNNGEKNETKSYRYQKNHN